MLFICFWIFKIIFCKLVFFVWEPLSTMNPHPRCSLSFWAVWKQSRRRFPPGILCCTFTFTLSHLGAAEPPLLGRQGPKASFRRTFRESECRWHRSLKFAFHTISSSQSESRWPLRCSCIKKVGRDCCCDIVRNTQMRKSVLVFFVYKITSCACRFKVFASFLNF